MSVTFLKMHQKSMTGWIDGRDGWICDEGSVVDASRESAWWTAWVCRMDFFQLFPVLEKGCIKCWKFK